MKNLKDWHIIILAAVLLFLCSCATQKRCERRWPVQTRDSIAYVEKVKDTTIFIQPDSALSQYLVECYNTSEGYKARIVQLLTQQPGTIINTPTASMVGQVLTARATSDEQRVRVITKELHYKAVKAITYVKITNQLTGWQWAQVWAGRLMILLVVIYAALLIVRRYTKSPF